MNSSLSLRLSPMLVLASTAYALSWLLPNHHIPWPDFYSDVLASGVLWFVAFAIIWRTQKKLCFEWSFAAGIVAICMLIISLQYVFGVVKTLGLAWISLLYLLGLLIAIVVGSAWERYHPGQCADFLFLTVLIGALGSFAIQLLQWTKADTGSFFWLFVPAPSRRFYANLGQPNQLATLQCLGVIACFWFSRHGLLKAPVAMFLSMCLALGIALTESRTTWVVIFCVAIILLLVNRKIKFEKKIIYGMLGWVAFYVVCILLLPHITVLIGRSENIQELRGVSTSELRLEYWWKLLHIQMNMPWYGYGWMQTSFAQFVENPFDMVSDGTFRHAHNFFMDIMNYVGIYLGLLLIISFLLFITCVTLKIKKIDQLVVFLFLVPVGVHSLLEYPLHYAYFLLPVGLVLGVISSAVNLRPVIASGALPVVACMIFSAAGILITTYDYLKIENSFFSLRFEQQRLENTHINSEVDVVALTHLGDMLWLSRVDPSVHHSESDIKRALNSTLLLPSLISQYKLATMYAFANKVDKANYWIVVMTRMNKPSAKAVQEIRRQWNEQAQYYPVMSKVTWPN